MVPQIVKSKSGQRTFDLLDVSRTFPIGANLPRILAGSTGWAGNQPCQVSPRRAPAGLWQCRIEMARLTRGEYIVVGLDLTESLCTSVERKDRIQTVVVQRNHTLTRV